MNLVLSKSTNTRRITNCRRFCYDIVWNSQPFSLSLVRKTSENFYGQQTTKVYQSSADKVIYLVKACNHCQRIQSRLTKFLFPIDEMNSVTGKGRIKHYWVIVYFLRKFDTWFIVMVFKKIFTFSDVVFDIHQNKFMDTSYMFLGHYIFPCLKHVKFIAFCSIVGLMILFHSYKLLVIR